MSIIRTFALIVMLLGFSGCTREQHSPPTPQVRPQSLSQDEMSHCKQVAWDAAQSREMWERFSPKRITTEPIKLDTTGIQYYLDQEHLDRVEVAIPSGGRLGWHRCFIGVTVARNTYEVLAIRESFWP